MSARARIRGIAFDVDGVFTDGTVAISSSGEESKRFSIPDGTAILWCRMLGYELAIVSGRESGATAIRAEVKALDHMTTNDRPIRAIRRSMMSPK